MTNRLKYGQRRQIEDFIRQIVEPRADNKDLFVYKNGWTDQSVAAKMAEVIGLPVTTHNVMNLRKDLEIRFYAERKDKSPESFGGGEVVTRVEFMRSQHQFQSQIQQLTDALAKFTASTNNFVKTQLGDDLNRYAPAA